MTTQKNAQAYVNASYVVTPGKAEMKVVVAKKEPVQAKPKSKFVKTYYSIDSNGGGYTGL